ncbi:hypothetical protein F4820DRAFT_414535 [Hypoxylon rubiginosum]|uniref:Uncharacterized protein n=1 Tax=Hypoxylon rubiginosum TaxID=110542 RepID=A0ACB9Z5U4_9PEZI|nr:hypothetical protein F4820DRAFT_414535 [Hypoxylon rubiginosum]
MKSPRRGGASPRFDPLGLSLHPRSAAGDLRARWPRKTGSQPLVESHTPNASQATMLALLPRDMGTTGEQAVSYQRKGKLGFAETFFRRISQQLSDMRDNLPLKLVVRLQVASTRLHLGKYREAKDDLEAIQRDIKSFVPITEGHNALKTGFDFDCRRWLASHMLHTGEWRNAAEAFTELLGPEWEAQHLVSSYKIFRDLALACAYLGEYKLAREHITRARIQLDYQRDFSTSTNHEELQIKYSVVGIVESTINMLSGDYPRALGIASRSLACLEATLGPGHFRTLSAASLKAWCLVHEGRFEDSTSEEYKQSLADVESFCLSTCCKLAQALSPQHPLALDSVECFVRILICQGRLAEAIDTGTALYNKVAQSPGEHHPQAISCKYQLAAANFAQGNCRTSISLYKDAITEATEVLGPAHPKTTKYSCELARAYLSFGAIEEAEAIATKGATQQVRHFCQDWQPSHWTPSIPSLMKRLKDYMAENFEHRLHPDMVCSLQLLAEIEFRKYKTKGLEGNLDLAEKILKFLAMGLSAPGSDMSVLKASGDFLLAIVIRDRFLPTGNRIHESIGMLEEVVRGRKRLLGDDHPDTARAHRELIGSRFLLDFALAKKNPEKRVNFRGFISAAENIISSLESRYGPEFHQTLHVRHWRLLSGSILGRFQRYEVEEEVQAIGRILVNPQLVSERPYESISMRNTLVECLIKFGISSLAHQLLGSAEQDIEKALQEDVDGSLLGALARLGGDVERLRSSSEKMLPN